MYRLLQGSGEHGYLVNVSTCMKNDNLTEPEETKSHVHMRENTHSDNAGISRLPQ